MNIKQFKQFNNRGYNTKILSLNKKNIKAIASEVVKFYNDYQEGTIIVMGHIQNTDKLDSFFEEIKILQGSLISKYCFLNSKDKYKDSHFIRGLSFPIDMPFSGRKEANVYVVVLNSELLPDDEITMIKSILTSSNCQVTLLDKSLEETDEVLEDELKIRYSNLTNTQLWDKFLLSTSSKDIYYEVLLREMKSRLETHNFFDSW